MSQIITVFGATGIQGGSVIKSLLSDPSLSKKFKVRGVTRDVSKPAAEALAKLGVEVVQVRVYASFFDATFPIEPYRYRHLYLL